MSFAIAIVVDDDPLLLAYVISGVLVTSAYSLSISAILNWSC